MEYEGGPIKLYSARHRRLLGVMNIDPPTEPDSVLRDLSFKYYLPLAWDVREGTPGRLEAREVVLKWDSQLGGMVVPTGTPLSEVPFFELL